MIVFGSLAGAGGIHAKMKEQSIKKELNGSKTNISIGQT